MLKFIALTLMIDANKAEDGSDFHPMAIQQPPPSQIPQQNVVMTSPNQNVDVVSREEILRQIFGDVGELIDGYCYIRLLPPYSNLRIFKSDFSCAVESTVLLHGRMYVTNRFLCFYSNLFGLEKKIRIPYSHITLVTKENTALVIPNAIAVSTREFTTNSLQYISKALSRQERVPIPLILG